MMLTKIQTLFSQLRKKYQSSNRFHISSESTMTCQGTLENIKLVCIGKDNHIDIQHESTIVNLDIDIEGDENLLVFETSSLANGNLVNNTILDL